MYLNRNCPTCGKNKIDSDFLIASTPRAEEMPLEFLAKSWRGFFKKRSFFTYLKCFYCGQVYCSTYFNEDQLMSLYSAMEDNTANLDKSIMSRTQKKYAEDLSRLAELKNGNVLELGPDIGLFAHEIEKMMSVNHFLFIEPNITVHEKLLSNIECSNVGLLHHHDEIKNIPDNSLSLITAIHVLDHLLDPGEVIDELYQKLISGGVLFLVTHNVDSMMARILKKRWPAFCLQHPQLYSKTSLSHLLQSRGFEHLIFKNSTNYFPVNYLLKHFLYALGVKINSFPFFNNTIGLKLGNLITVAVK